MRGWQRMDRDIQRRLKEAEESGDPDRIKREQQFANESYGMGTGLTIGATIGTFIFPGVGTVIGGAIGGFLGHKAAEE